MSQKFNIGATVWTNMLSAYLKIVDSMPMLRSPSYLEPGAVGIIVERKPGNYWAVRFDTGAFLLKDPDLELNLPEIATQKLVLLISPISYPEYYRGSI